MEQFTGTTVGFWNTGGRRGIHILFLGEESPGSLSEYTEFWLRPLLLSIAVER